MRTNNLLPRNRKNDIAVSPFMQNDFLDRLFDISFPWKVFQTLNRGENRESRFLPRVDIHNTEKEYILTAEIPGVSKDNIHIEVHDGILTLSGEKKEERKEGDGKMTHLVERSFGTFSRTMTVPEDGDIDHIQASHKDGVLTVRIPRKQEQKAGKTIAIQSA
jgi:HSP20 family protein